MVYFRFMKTATKIAYIILTGLLLSLAAAMVYYPMCFGLVEDAQILQLVRTSWQHLSLFEILRDYSDMDGGSFRPVETFFIYIFYGPLQSHPKLFYLINYGFVILAMFLWVVMIRGKVSPRFRAEWTIMFSCLLLVATPLYNLTTHLVLQEKYVILFAGLSYYALDRALAIQNLSNARWWALQGVILISILFGFWSKATFIAFMPWILLAIALSTNLALHRKWTTLLIFLTTTGMMGYLRLSHRSSYNLQYRTDLAGLLERIHYLPKSFYVFSCLGISTLSVLIYLRWKRQLDHRAWIGFLLWPISLLSYLAVMIPWGINTYYWTPAMAPACGCLVILGDLYFRKMPLFAARGVLGLMTVSMILACVGVFGVGIPRLARQSEIGMVADWLSRQLPNERVTVYVEQPCMEATSSLAYYAGGRQPFNYLQQSQVPQSPQATWWLITRDECNIAAKHAPLFDRVIYESPHWKIYQHDAR